jgi:signal transduction histidine kinase
MLENFELAVKRQKKLIIIFLLTIFIPSISLSIFGIRAIRNERFRLATQVEDEHRRAAELLKSQVSAQFDELGSLLLKLTKSPVFLQRDTSGIKNLLDPQLAANPLVDFVFVAFEKEEAWFPLFQPDPSAIFSSPTLGSDEIQQSELKRAQDAEFKDKNYKRAISLYRSLADRSEDTNFKAQMLANVARCFVKLEDYAGAIQNYQRICEVYPDTPSSSGIPFALFCRLEMARCHRNLGEFQSALQIALNLYKDILDRRWPLRESQFKTYANLVEETLDDILSVNQSQPPRNEDSDEFVKLKKLHHERLEQWSVIRDISQSIIPELRDRQDLSSFQSVPHHFHKTVSGTAFLVSFVQIPDPSGIRIVGLLGAKVKEQYLIEHVLPDILENSQFRNVSNVVISRLSGNILLGESKTPEDPVSATEFFEDNFPPWKIEIFRNRGEALGALDLKRNFYFWTILTLVVVLVSGSVLISRTIAQEMAVLRLKSDFVSSVSHEFKSPLTSIKALAERLRDGKVKDSERMMQYFSVICQDTDRLTQLVRNILDFSKIEEGKKEYEFVATDVAQLLAQQIEIFKRSEYTKGFEIRIRISEDIPHLDVDKEALSQALNNLLDNAAKFSSGRKEIEVQLRKDDSNVIIEVTDWGIGIPPQDLNRVFDKFYQGRNTLRQSSKGTGLGLTLVKHTVEAHRGRIVVKSRTGEGSTFSIVLPIQRERK